MTGTSGEGKMTMLVAIKDNGRVEPITRLTHRFEFNQWMRRLAPADFDSLCDALNQYIDTQGGGEIITSSWITFVSLWEDA
jgi:hypothetical protein